MNAQTTIEPLTRRGGRKPTNPVTPVPAPTAAAAVVTRLVPSAPQLLPLADLFRAPENVRHVRQAEDVKPLAADIAAHGLLQSLIGYQTDNGGRIETAIVGGGRRLQALLTLAEDGLIDATFKVPVLIRDIEDAVELSLAENLQQRTMSPVDEFLAFRALIETGHHDAKGLAKRFGFSERVVKQRLRLAELAPEILDALAERTITIDAAQAYAASQDRALQLEVFAAEQRRARSYRDTHRPHDIRHTLAMKGATTDDALFKFVGAAAYEAKGGRYEDDLFLEEKGGVRTLANPALLQEVAREQIDRAYQQLAPDLVCDLAPTITGYLVATDLRVKSWGNIAPKPTAGFVMVEKADSKPMWRTIRNNAIEAKVLVGVNDDGKLVAWPRMVFVPKAQKEAIAPTAPAEETPRLTPEQQALAARAHEVNRSARRLAVVAAVAGTPVEGTIQWPTGYNSEPRGATRAGVNGWLVPTEVFVSEDQIAAVQAAAEAHVDAAIAARTAKEKRKAEILAADPPPAAILVDGLLHYRWSNNLWSDEPQPADDDEAGPRPVAYRLDNLLHRAEVIGPDWPSSDAQRADAAELAGAGA